MALKGSIKEFALTEIFQLIFHQNKEGILTLTRENTKVSVLFNAGKIIRAYEGDYDEVFGKSLLKAEIITDDQLGIVRYRLQNQRTSMEALFAELNILSESELLRLSRLFTEETLYRLFHWENGDYEFQQKTITFNSNLVSPLETQFLLMEAVRQIDEWPALLKKIPSREMIFERTLELEDLDRSSDKTELCDEKDPFGSIDELDEENAEEKEQAWLLEQLNGLQTVQQIIDRAQMGAFAVHQGIVNLLKEKKIQELKGAEAWVGSNAQVPAKRSVLKGVTAGVIIFMTLFIFIVFYPAMQRTALMTMRPAQEFKGLTLKNERYFIRFALDLYYLKHNRYPDTLQVLIDDGYLGSKSGVGSHIKNWSYRVTPDGEAKYLLRFTDPN